LDRPVEFSFAQGRLVVHDTGTILYGAYKVKALQGRDAHVDGDTLIGWKDVQTALVVGKTVFLGGKQSLLRYWQGFAAMPASTEFPPEAIASVTAVSGQAAIMTDQGVYQSRDGGWEKAYRFPFPSREVYLFELRGLTFLKDGGLLTGTWGFGLTRTGGKEQNWFAGNSCLTPIAEGGEYTIVKTVSDPRGDDVWAVQLANNDSKAVYRLAHFDQRSGDLSCAEIQGPGNKVEAVRILSDDILGVAGENGVHFYRYGLAGVKNRVALAGKLSATAGGEAGRDLALDRFGRLWTLFNGA